MTPNQTIVSPIHLELNRYCSLRRWSEYWKYCRHSGSWRQRRGSYSGRCLYESSLWLRHGSHGLSHAWNCSTHSPDCHSRLSWNHVWSRSIGRRKQTTFTIVGPWEARVISSSNFFETEIYSKEGCLALIYKTPRLVFGKITPSLG